ncbi:MAG: hypothetical protein JST59_02280 [Actinobacteria bacterium]|nr:hypothetical protein [Actinomycetota bacterium]
MEKTRELFPNCKIILTGHSLGGHLSVLYLSYLLHTGSKMKLQY